MADQQLAFRITASASGMNAGIAQAEKNLQKVSVSAAATSKELAQAARVTESVKTPAEKYAQKVEKLDKFLSKGIITQETYSRAVSKAEKDMRSAEEATNGAASAVQRFGDSAAAASEKVSSVEAIADSLMNAAKKASGFATGVGMAFAQYKLGAALKSPSAFLEFSTKAVKVVATTRNLVTGLKLLGVGFAVAGGSAGVLGTAALAVTNPMVGLGLAIINVTRQFFASRDAAYETAKAVSELSLEAATTGKSLQDLNIQKALDSGVARQDMIAMGVAISALDVGHFNDLADAMEKSTAGAKRLEQAEAGVTKTIGGAFIGLLEGLSNGFAGLRNGLADLTAGFNTLLTPVAQAIRPVGTLLGVVANAAMSLVGVVGSLGGAVLRVAGLAATVLLSPFIVGLNNLADAIKVGVGGAFDWVSKKIASFNAMLDTAYNYLSKMPVVGSVFASNQGGVVKAAEGGTEGGATGPQDAMAGAAEATDDFTKAIRRQEDALSAAIDKATKFGAAGFDAAVQFQDGLRGLQGDLEAGILNETSYAQAADKLRQSFEDQIGAMESRAAAARALAEEDSAGEQSRTAAMTKQTDAFLQSSEAAHEFGAAGAAASAEYEGGLTSLNAKLEDGRVNEETYAREAEKLREKFKGQVDQLKNVRSAENKRADDLAKMGDKVADAGRFKDEATKTLGGRSDEALQGADIRSAEGIKSFMALASGREDPAVAEYRKSHATLQSMLAELKALQAAPLEIAGAAGG